MDTLLKHTNNFVIYTDAIWSMPGVAPGDGNGTAFTITEAKCNSVYTITLATAQKPLLLMFPN